MRGDWGGGYGVYVISDSTGAARLGGWMGGREGRKETKPQERIGSARNAAQLMDGISASTFKQIGDGDAASAVKRVTGVSIEGGKYIYVRGLGDRYENSAKWSRYSRS